jgi:hypothetical protein
VTANLAAACNGRMNCNYQINYKVLGDPARGCAKTFIVYYRCLPNPAVHVCQVGAEAGWAGEGGRPNYVCELDCRR